MTTLIVYGLFFAVFSVGSVLGAAFEKSRYEEALPCGVLAVGAVLYPFGWLGRLSWGVYALLALTALAYAVSAVRLIRKKSWKAFGKRLFTPCFWFFSLAYFVFLSYDHNLVSSLGDEFSHWFDILRVMLQFDSYGLNPATRSYFGVYPPAVSLMEYFPLALRYFLGGDGQVVEHLGFLGMQVLSLSLFLPFLGRVEKKGKNTLAFLCCGVFAFTAPLMANHGYYAQMFVDQLLGILAGFCFLYPAVFCKKPLEWVTFGLGLTTLALAKNSGILLALLALGTCAAFRFSRATKGLRWKALRLPLAALGLTLAAFGSWKWLIEWNRPLYSEPWAASVTLKGVWDALFSRGDVGAYGHSVILHFVAELFTGENGSLIEKLPVSAAFTFALLLLVLEILLLMNRQTVSNKTRRVSMAAMLVSLATFVAGICLTYVFELSEKEAGLLSSFARYMRTPLTLLLTVIFGLFCYTLGETGPATPRVKAGMLLTLILLFPYQNFGNEMILKTASQKAAEFRVRPDYVTAKVKEKITDPEARIFLVSNYPARDDYFTLKSLLRPLVIENHNFYIHPKGTLPLTGLSQITRYSDEQFSATQMSVEQWKEILKNGYDYVLLYYPDSEFYVEYPAMFVNPEGIYHDSLYKVTPEGKLEYIPF